MPTTIRVGLVWFLIVLFIGACASPPAGGSTPGASESASSPPTYKRISAAIRGAPASLVQQRSQRAGGIRGLDGIEELATAGLT